MAFLFRGGACPYLLLFIPEVVVTILLSCFYMSRVPTYSCHIIVSPSDVAQTLLVVDKWGKWGSCSLWVSENTVKTVLGSDVLSYYCSKKAPPAKLPYSRPEKNMVANCVFFGKNKNSEKQGGRKANISHTLVLPQGRYEGYGTLLSSSVHWCCSWPLSSCDPGRLKANLWLFNQTMLVPCNLDVRSAVYENFLRILASVRCYCGG